MKKFDSMTIIRQILYDSPHQRLKRVHSISCSPLPKQLLYPPPIARQTLHPSSILLEQSVSAISKNFMPPPPKYYSSLDQAYIEHLLYFDIDCAYLLEQSFSPSNYKMNMISEFPMVFSKPITSGRRSSRSKVGNQLENKLASTIKKLNDNPESIVSYLQAEELISGLTATQARQHKKYLVYLYKFLLNYREKANLTHSSYKFRQQLKQLVVLKIEEGHQETKQTVRIELRMFEQLAGARSCIHSGDVNKAKNSYQQIFNEEKYDPNVRMEALEYLCKSSQEKGDISYLQSIISRLKKTQGQERYRKYVENVLKELQNKRNPCQTKRDSA